MAKASRSSSSKKTSKPIKRKTTSDIIKRHLSNKNDKITEDDFKDLHIETSIPDDRANEPLDIKEDNERPKDVEKDNKTTTPWDVINE